MRQLRRNASSEDRVNQGIELAIGIEQFPEAAPLAATVRTQTEQLDQLRRAREQKQRELMPLRVYVKVADYTWDQTVRGFSRTLEVADGGSRGAMHLAIFSDGIGPLVTPSGAGQLKSATAFVARVEAAKTPGLDKVRSEWMPRIKDAQKKLTSAIEARDAAHAVVGQARVVEEAAREDHARMVDKLMGEVRALYPRDRTRWNVIFPPVGPSGAQVDDDDDDGASAPGSSEAEA